MKPYKSSNQIPNIGFIVLMGTAILGGAAIGILTYILSLFIYIVLIFPVMMGFAGGNLFSLSIQRGKARDPWMASAIGIIMGCVIYGSLHLGKYWQFQQIASSQILVKMERSSNQVSANEIVDRYLEEQTGSTGFVGYLKHTAQQGVLLVSTRSSSSNPTNLGETGSWIYWLLELLLVNGIIVYYAYTKAKRPFCESCDEWYSDAITIGNVSPRHAKKFLNLIQSNQLSEAITLSDPLQGGYVPSLVVQVQSCPSCAFNHPVFSVSSTSFDEQNKLRLKILYQNIGSFSDYSQVNRALAANCRKINVQDDDQTAFLLYLGRAERFQLAGGDYVTHHGLNPDEESYLGQELSRYPQIKEAYLVKKITNHFPEQPFYVLGVLRRVRFLDLERAGYKFSGKLMTELDLPKQTLVISLNYDKSSLKMMKKISGQAIYKK